MTLAERCKKVMPPMANRTTDLGIDHAKGCYLYTDDGREILDFASGIGVCNLGHNYPSVVEAAKNQMDKLVHGCHNLVYYEEYVKLAEKLVELTGGDTKVYFMNSGAESIDGALKLAKYVTQRPAVIGFKGAFHGRTMGAATMTASNSKYRKNIETGLMNNVYYLDYPYLLHTPYPYDGKTTPEFYFKQFDELFGKLVDPERVACILMEPVQGEGGYIVPPKDWMVYVRELCTKYGILLIYDEVQSGFGRTGKMFAQEHFGIRPDIMTCAKGIANGLPLSAIIAKADIMDQWPAGAHGGTFGGNPVACAAANATIEVLESGVVDNAAKMGEYFMKKLDVIKEKYSCIAEVRGLGLMIGVELLDADGNPETALADAIQKRALEKGLFILTCGSYKNCFRFIAPLIVTEKEIDKAIAIVDEVLAEIAY